MTDGAKHMSIILDWVADAQAQANKAAEVMDADRWLVYSGHGIIGFASEIGFDVMPWWEDMSAKDGAALSQAVAAHIAINDPQTALLVTAIVASAERERLAWARYADATATDDSDELTRAVEDRDAAVQGRFDALDALRARLVTDGRG